MFICQSVFGLLATAAAAAKVKFSTAPSERARLRAQSQFMASGTIQLMAQPLPINQRAVSEKRDF